MQQDKSVVLESIKQLLLNTIGMEYCVIKHSPYYESECYVFKGEYYRIDTFKWSKDTNERVYCIEWAENEREAQLNLFEDSWLYYDTMELQEMLEAIKNDILNS